MKIFKKIISLTLILLVCFSCSSLKTNDDSSYYLKLLEEFEPRDKNLNNHEDNEEFENYLNSIYIDTISDSYLYMHNNVRDYKSLNIVKPEVTWGEVIYDSQEDIDECIIELSELKTYDYDSLSYRQQYDYDLYEYSLLESIVYMYYEKYDLLFSKGNDLFGNIVTTLDEFTFYDEESIEDYLILLEDLERYFDELIKYNEKQANDKIFNSDESLNYQIDYIESFTSKVNDNALITSFNNRINSLSYLTVDEKEVYKNKNEELIINTLIPVFNNIKEELTKYLGKGNRNDQALINIDENYAKINLYINTSSNDSVDEIYNKTKDTLDKLIINYQVAAQDEEVVREYIDNYEGKYAKGFNLSDKETLNYLYANMNNYFSKIDNVNYEVSPLDESSASDTVVAYYVSPPLDDLDLNVIRTNPNNMSDDPIYAYLVLAHEGLPGHMYQNLYFQNTNPNPFRATQEFIGYTEGWACYASNMAFKFVGFKNEGVSDILALDNNFAYLLYSLCDININYYGYSVKLISNFLEEYGIDEEMAQDIYDIVINQPGVYLRYGTGYAYFMDLYYETQDELKDEFVDSEFNNALLNNGPLPFVLLEQEVKDYIDSH